MPKILRILLCICTVIMLAASIPITPTYSDELDDINKQINDLTSALNQSVAATKPLESQLTSMQNQINDIKNRVSSIETDMVVKKKNIDEGYKNLASKENLLNQTVRDYYIKSYYNNPLQLFFSAGSASEITQILAYQKAKTNQDKSVITNIALTITDLETRKAALESEQKRLVSLKANLDEQSTKLASVVSGAKAYQSQLNSKIAALTAEQQQFIAQKQGTLNIPTSAYTTQGGCSSDLTNGKDPGFSPRFAVFTYGVPHRVGMSQYGAKGRAEAGQNYRDILSAYFPNTSFGSVDQGTQIHVKGTNEYGQTFDDTWNIEEYTKHIYEIPASWPGETLKAQAIAARTYGYKIQQDKGYVLPSQSDQVVKKELNADAWIQAVNDTAGQILTYNGAPIQAWFSSTAGGYTFSAGTVWGSDKPWTKNGPDANGSISSWSDLNNNAYDKQSPWFYCDWGGRSQYAGTAWLKPEELADIANVILLARKDSGTRDHLYQTDKSNPKGTDTWDSGRVKQELKNRGGTPYNSISSASVNPNFGSGVTSSITLNGDAGSTTFDGNEFENFFNLRAPANINIVGPLFNIEQR